MGSGCGDYELRAHVLKIYRMNFISPFSFNFIIADTVVVVSR